MSRHISSMLSREEFVKKYLELLKLEEDAEVLETLELQKNYSLKQLQSKGVCLLNLEISESRPRMFGRKVIVFQNANENEDLPANCLKSGDVVGIWQANTDCLVTDKILGVISEVKLATIAVALDKVADESRFKKDKAYNMFRMSYFTSFKHMQRALKKMCDERGEIKRNMIEVMFGEKEPSTIDPSTLKINFVNEKLNEVQREAVKFALCQKEIAVIHGPPGTGKTTTLVEIILQLVQQGLKVLACAPSNVATDNLVEGLGEYTKNIVRLGHPARTIPVCLEYNIDSILSNSNDNEVINDIQQNISALASCIEGNSFGNVLMKSLRQERRALEMEKKQRYKKSLLEKLQKRDVIISTLASANNYGNLSVLPSDFFDVAVIDECPQALEAACWIPLMYVKKCILAGDHCQLPPVIICEEAERQGLGVTLMERVIKIHGDSIKKLLTVQYRMHEDIVRWPSEHLYEGQLKSHESVAHHLLQDIPGVESNQNTGIPLLLIDTVGCQMWDYGLDDESKCNEGEGKLVAIHVTELIDSGLNASDIAVVTPYNLQVELIKELLSQKYPSLEIRSVDGFQGREKEAVVLSLVRSNAQGNVGFLRESRRINVGITRAKRHLAVICDSRTVSNSSFLCKFVKYMKDKGEVRSAFTYESELNSFQEITFMASVEEKCMKSDSRNKVKAKQMNKPKKNSKKTVPCVTKDEIPSYHCNDEQTYKQAEERLRAKYRKIIDEFLNGSEGSMEFPNTLSRYVRMVIHEISEELNIVHRSVGEGEERFIVISKPSNDGHASTEKRFAAPTTKEEGTNSRSCSFHIAEFASQNKYVQGDEIAASFDLQTPEASENLEVLSQNNSVNSEMPICVSARVEPKKADKKKNIQKQAVPTAKKNKKPLKPSALEKCSDQDFDALIETAIKMDNTCRFASCKNHTAVLLQTCTFCNIRFCLKHFLPEIHGCGAAAKAHARSTVRKESAVGSGRPAKNSSVCYHYQVRFRKKLEELSKERKQGKKY